MTTEKDLLGDPLVDPFRWRIFEMNDHPEYWIARSLDEAKEAAFDAWGGEVEDADDAYELSDDALDVLTLDVADYERDADAEPIKSTFREELNRRIAKGLTGPEFFAASE